MCYNQIKQFSTKAYSENPGKHLFNGVRICKTKHFWEKISGGSIASSQSVYSCSKLTIETLEQGVKYVQS